MQHFVDDRFKIDIFLDTNILVDYVLNTKPALTHSINYLNNKKSVRLRSSHYVEFELTEVLKLCYFGYVLFGHYPNNKEKSQIRSNNWYLKNVDYAQKMEEIKLKVNQKMSILKSTFERLFDDHVLHEKLIEPTCNLFLQTNVSREDSLVTISSVYPKRDESLEFVALLSNDSRFCSAINKNETVINTVMDPCELKRPIILNAKRLCCSSIKSHINLSDCNYDNSKIEKFWDYKILDLVKKKNEDTFIGSTYKFGKPGTISGECIYFSLNNTSILKKTDYLLFFTNNADETISIKINKNDGKLEFWNANHPVTLPNDNPKNLKYSFRPLEGMLDSDEIEKLREPKNLVFYLNE